MKTFVTVIAGFVVATLSFSVSASAATYAFADTSRTSIDWFSDAPMEKIKGTASGATGSVTFDPANPQGLTGSVSVPVKSMKSGNPIRDRHLKGAKWLDAGKYPNLVFKVTKVTAATRAKSKSDLKLNGTFTCHGVTKAISVPATIKWNAKTLKLTTKFTIKLADYKVAGSSGTIGNKVGKTIEIKATLYGAAR